jgi:hypothetical protein
MGEFRELILGGEIHVLDQGITYCGLSPAQSEWPEFDLWVRHQDWAAATCEKCQRRAATRFVMGEEVWNLKL